MNEFTRITVPLSQDEFYKLREVAAREYRHPREQARYLLRCILLDDGATKDNTSTVSLEPERAGVAGITP
jgi:hypothetical protein